MFYFHGTRKPDFIKTPKINYDAYWKDRGFKMRDKLMERERVFFDWVARGSRVLDVGCGSSRLLFELKKRKSCTCKGLDISPLVVENLPTFGIESAVADIESQNFTLIDSFDYIIASEVLEHLREPEEFIQKIKNHARFFIFSIPNSAFYRYRIGLLLNGRFFTQWTHHPSEHLRYWSHIDFLDWLSAMKLRVLKTKASNGFWFKDSLPNLFGHQMCYLAEARQ